VPDNSSASAPSYIDGVGPSSHPPGVQDRHERTIQYIVDVPHGIDTPRRETGRQFAHASLPRLECLMHKPLAGGRILEVAQFTYLPSAGAVLADWVPKS
jgi:hypothetical protein